MRPRIVPCVLAVALPLAAFAQAPTIHSGECLYLIGAPPGAPAATTEQAYDGTKVYDVSTHIPHVEVGRDAPHRLTVWIEHVSRSTQPSGTLAAAWTEEEMNIDAPGPTLLSLSASGDYKGVFGSLLGFSVNATVVLRLDLLQLGNDNEWRTVTSREVLDRTVASLRLDLDESWATTLIELVPRGGTYRLRLTLELKAEDFFYDLDFGSPGTGRGAGFTSIEACTTPLANTPPSDDSLERDLYERRCMPTVWLPASQGGRLEEARSLVENLTSRAEASGESGANLAVTRARLQQADTDAANGRFQRACRDLVDAIHGLTTP